MLKITALTSNVYKKYLMLAVDQTEDIRYKFNSQNLQCVRTKEKNQFDGNDQHQTRITNVLVNVCERSQVYFVLSRLMATKRKWASAGQASVQQISPSVFVKCEEDMWCVAMSIEDDKNVSHVALAFLREALRIFRSDFKEVIKPGKDGKNRRR